MGFGKPSCSLFCLSSSDIIAQALEDGEDMDDIGRKRGGRADNKLLAAEASNRGTPMSDSESRGRKGKKGKSKMGDYEPAGGKRKRGLKSMSVTPSMDGEDDDDRDTVCIGHFFLSCLGAHASVHRNGEKQKLKILLPRFAIG